MYIFTLLNEKPSKHNVAAGNLLTQTLSLSQGAMELMRSSLSFCFPFQKPCLRGARPLLYKQAKEEQKH